MTTNAYDIDAGIFASDSRWSFTTEDNWMFYVDDTNYDKIVFDDTLVMLFAGDMVLIEEWKNWFKQWKVVPMPIRNTTALSVCVCDLKTGAIAVDSGSSTKSNQYRFAGTGAPHALNCWLMNKCAKRAVVTATTMDQCTGGSVCFLERTTRGNNVKNSESYDSVYQQLNERGMMKNLNDNTQQPIPIKDAMNDSSSIDTVAKQVAKRVMAGQINLCAPFAGMHQEWSDEKKQEFIDVIEKYKQQ